jgi:hypothetical protein
MGLARRKEFHDILEGVIESENVYFQPPEGRVMQYPCIVYERDNASLGPADNFSYKVDQRYQVTLIDQNPDSDAVDKLLALPFSAFNRHFATSGLNHDVFVIYH